MNIKETVRKQISNLVDGAISKCGFEAVAYQVETPREKANGDFSTNAAMLLTKIAKKAPRMIAEELVSNMDCKDTYIEKVEIAGPGFINFYLNKNWLYDVIDLVEKMGNRYGSIDYGKGKKVMVEFISANPTGPMHMGNARGGALGDSMAAVLDFAGFDVTREFYLNDAGNQVEKFACSLEARYLQQCGVDVPFEEEWYQGADITQRAIEFIEINGDKFVNAESDQRKKALVDYALNKNVELMKKTLGDYRVNYDVWFYESELHNNGEVMKTVEILKENGYTYEKDGAIWLKSADEEEKDDVLVRANGIPTYFAADIAYHRNKFVTRGFDRVIDVWGADHHGHVARMKYAMDAVGVEPDKLEVVLMQLVRLMRNGEVARMSKRTGKAITLDDLLEEIGIDAARFFFNMRNAGSHFDFDLDLAVEQSNNNPVFYVQYAHARIASIINSLKEEGVNVKSHKDVDLSLLNKQEEFDLIEKLAQYPQEITISAQTEDPSRITRYVLDVASLFHTFYNAPDCRVKCDDENLMASRLLMINCVKTVIGNALDLLGIDAPEKM